MKKHNKHVFLKKPNGGYFHRNEFGFIGAPCSTIQILCDMIVLGLKGGYNIGYMDADHGSGDSSLNYHTVYTDKINFHQVNFEDSHTDYSLKQKFETCSGLLINANHFKSDQQIVIINEKKRESLSRKLDKLTNVKAFILDEGMNVPFDFLKESVANYEEVPILSIENIDSIIELIIDFVKASNPSLFGLLLYGGKSTRMGSDKGRINYHGSSQVDYLSDLMKKYCDKTYVSKSQLSDGIISDDVITDTFTDLGPFGGILSAFRANPNSAYFTLPCDVPFIDAPLIELLISERDPSKMATCFHNKETGFPEPLITIWEPRAYPSLLHFLSMGYSCPRKVLINSDIKEIEPPHDLSLYNANTPEELAFAKEKLKTLK